MRSLSPGVSVRWKWQEDPWGREDIRDGLYPHHCGFYFCGVLSERRITFQLSKHTCIGNMKQVSVHMQLFNIMTNSVYYFPRGPGCHADERLVNSSLGISSQADSISLSMCYMNHYITFITRWSIIYFNYDGYSINRISNLKMHLKKYYSDDKRGWCIDTNCQDCLKFLLLHVS